MKIVTEFAYKVREIEHCLIPLKDGTQLAARNLAVRLRVAGGKYAGLAAKPDVDKSSSTLHRYHQRAVFEGCELRYYLAQPMAASGDYLNHRQRRLRNV